MCGINGVFNYFNKSKNIRSIVEKINKIQFSRGPDDNGIWQSNCHKICFGHTRLSIIDLTKNAQQPFISEDKKFTITFNGEIYNYKELKSELIKKNIKFRSKSDTEVILEAYKFWGIEFVKKLRGMYAFAIWDDVNNKLILARDPFGIKPLYYSNKDGIYYFASQVKSLLSINEIGSSYSNAGIVSFYLWGNLQDPFTLYKDIKSILPGSCVSIDINGNQKIYKFADIKETMLNSNSLNLKNDNEKQEYLFNAINETVNAHQVSDVPITVLLSSGVDSNVILSAINDNNKKNCSALTLNFNYKNNEDEVNLAKKSSLLNKINDDVLKISDDEFSTLIEDFFLKMDIPTNDGFNNFLVSYLARKNNSKIIISGIGGDELFSGYPSFNIIPKIRNILRFIPNNKLLNLLNRNILYPLLKKGGFKTKYSGILEYGREINSSFFLLRSLFLPNEAQEIISDDVFRLGIEELNLFDNCKKDIEGFSDEKLSIMYLEIKYYLCSKLLRDSDWASMANSIELRTPFVDWTFFNKIIPLLKANKNLNKGNLLDCFRGKIPNQLYNRKKTGFTIPHEKYLRYFSVKNKFSNSIRDWSLLSYKKYIENNLI